MTFLLVVGILSLTLAVGFGLIILGLIVAERSHND